MKISSQTQFAALPLPRLGQISFINTLPVVLPIERNLLAVKAQIILDNPSKLNQSFATGLLDLGAMSSFFYLGQNNYQLMSGLSISATGPVGSVLLFSKYELQDLTGKQIAVSASSATSVTLLKLLLLEQAGVKARLIAMEKPGLDDPEIAAALIIGDQALNDDLHYSSKFKRYDLGQEWQNFSGLPMVFGVWAARPDWAEQNPQSFAEISQTLVRSMSMGLNEYFAEVIAEARRRTGLTLDRLETYYRKELNFELTPRHLESLNLFKQLCLKHDLIG